MCDEPGERPRMLMLSADDVAAAELDIDEVYVLRLPDGGFQAMRFEGAGSWALERRRALRHDAVADAVAEVQASATYSGLCW